MKKLIFLFNIIIFILALIILVLLINKQNASLFIMLYWLFNSIKIGCDIFKRA